MTPLDIFLMLGSIERIDVDSELLTSKELADKLHKSTAALAQWRYKGLGPKFIKLGNGPGGVRYRARDVEAWLDEQTRSQSGQTFAGA